MQWREHLRVDPAVVHGKACVRGTQVAVAVMLPTLQRCNLLRRSPSATRRSPRRE
jgi:uncharacterized protein (DUF433 family)